MFFEQFQMRDMVCVDLDMFEKELGKKNYKEIEKKAIMYSLYGKKQAKDIREGHRKISDSYDGINWDKKIEHQKSSVRCKVEHPFLIVKRLFGYAKVVYKGIAKNMNRFFVLFASADC